MFWQLVLKKILPFRRRVLNLKPCFGKSVKGKIDITLKWVRKIKITMENYLVSARKYRPDTFRSVVGQKALTATLQNAIKNKQLAHAYLFCGPRGVGKTTCARIFAKAINCTHLGTDGEACNECESCRSFNEQRSYNIHELDAASNNSVDDIRQLTEQVRIPPQIGRYKVYIIDEVHMLSPSAFNAFLKTLEEPPAHAVFILATTEKHKIIPTILSRCQIYDFNRISIKDIQEHLQYVAQSEQVEAEPEALNVIATKADGGMRDALSIFDQVISFGNGKVSYKNVIENLNVLDYDYYFRLIDYILQGNVSDTLLLFNEILNKGFEGQHFLSGLCAHLRDLLVSLDMRTVSLLEVGEQIQENYKTQAKTCSFSFLVWALTLTNQCSLQYPQSKNKRLLVELCLIRLCQGEYAPDPSKDKAPNLKNFQAAASNTSTGTATSSSSAGTQANKDSTTSGTQTAHTPSHTQTDDAPANASNEKTAFIPPRPAREQSNLSNAQEQMPKTLSFRNRKANLENKASAETASGTEQIDEDLHESFSEDQLTAAWEDFANHLENDLVLKNNMLVIKPKLLENDIFEAEVITAQLKDSLEAMRHTLEKHLARSLRNSHIQMKVVQVENNDKNKKILIPQDQFVVMMKKNPSLEILKQELHLDLE